MVDVVVIGTAHHWHWENPMYSSGILLELIKKTEPDVICAELSPEQLNGTTTCNSKPEYPKAIIPFAERNKIPIVPIQPCTELGLEWGNRKRKEIERVKATSGLSEKWDFWMDLSYSMEEVESYSLYDYLSRGYDHWIEVIFDKLYPRLFPELGKLCEEWNRNFLKVIEKAIEEYPDSRITITVGNKHKYWLNNRLRKMESVRYKHIQDYLDRNR